MYKTFNCGIGFVVTVTPRDTAKILLALKDFKADIIGEIIPGSRIIEIESMFGRKIIKL